MNVNKVPSLDLAAGNVFSLLILAAYNIGINVGGGHEHKPQRSIISTVSNLKDYKCKYFEIGLIRYR